MMGGGPTSFAKTHTRGGTPHRVVERSPFAIDHHLASPRRRGGVSELDDVGHPFDVRTVGARAENGA